ncbi:glycosyl transferase, group 1 [Candidatus Saccharibacteria bacterium RAAC3_TM7_1]|nr:glycosyl transferase, group 1 [Candidatus Saccharibacteria bacterium RAAC3_TM7_1]
MEMRIAIDARIINSSTGRYVERLLHYLEKLDTENDYIVLVRRKDLKFWQSSNPRFSVQVAEYDNYSFAEQIGFKRFLDRLAPDLVHFCMPQQPILYRGKKITTIHDLTLLNTYNSDKNWLIFHAKQLVGRFVFKRVARSSDHLLTPTQYVKDDVVRFADVPADKVTVTYEAADVSHEALKEYDHPYKRFIVYVGQQSDYKNIRRLGEAHQALIGTRPDLGLILVGSLNASTLKNKRYFEKQGFRNILFTGFIPDGQKDWLLTHAEAYAFPSLMEGFGLPALEAMALGTPVVSSNATCLPEVYGDAAHYFDPMNTQDITRAVGQVLDDKTLREELSRRGKLQIKKYSWQRMAEQTLTVYRQILEKN